MVFWSNPWAYNLHDGQWWICALLSIYNICLSVVLKYIKNIMFSYTIFQLYFYSISKISCALLIIIQYLLTRQNANKQWKQNVLYNRSSWHSNQFDNLPVRSYFCPDVCYWDSNELVLRVRGALNTYQQHVNKYS